MSFLIFIFHILVYDNVGTTVIPALQLDRNCIAVESQSHLLLPTQTTIITKLNDENEADGNASVENDMAAANEHE